jgi:hypothetical protein
MSDTTTAFLKPYQAVKMVNERLDEVGLPGIRPQMAYNYTSARLNQGKEPYWGYTNERGVDLEVTSEWTEKYIAKKLAAKAEEPADPEQAEFDAAEAN